MTNRKLRKAIAVAFGAVAAMGLAGQAGATSISGTVTLGPTGSNQNAILPYSWDGGNIGYGDTGVPVGSTMGYAFYAPNQSRVGGANAMSGPAITNIDSDKNLGWNHNTKWRTFEIPADGGYTVSVQRVGSDVRLQPAFSLFYSGTTAPWDGAGGSHSFNQTAGPGTGPGQSFLNQNGNASSHPYMVTGGDDIIDFVGYANSGPGYTNAEGFTLLGALSAGTSTIGPLQNTSLPYNSTSNQYTSVITKGSYINSAAGYIAPSYAGGGSSVTTTDPTTGNGYVDLKVWLPAGFYAIAPGGSCNDFTCTATSGISVGANQTLKIKVEANPSITAPVPVPAAVWLFGSALAGMGVIGRRKDKPAA